MIRRIWTRTGCILHGPRAQYDISVTMVMLSCAVSGGGWIYRPLIHAVFVASARGKVVRGTGAAVTCTNMAHSRSALPPGRATWRAPVVRFALNGMGAVSSRVTLRGTPPDSRTDLSGDGEKRCATPAAFAPGDRGGARIAVWSTPTGPPTWKSTRTACTASVRGRCSESGRSTGSAGDGALLAPLRCLEPAAWGPAGQTVAVPARSALPGGKRRPVAGLPGGGGRSRKLEPPPRGPERDHQTSGRGRGGYWQSARPRKLPAAERAAHGAVRSARRRARVQERGEEAEVCAGILYTGCAIRRSTCTYNCRVNR